MTERHSGVVRQEIEALVKEYEALAKEELRNETVRSLMTIVRHNSSSWSGGHSTTNMFEQIVRTVAAGRLEKKISRL